jgi:hypothetical protein
MLILAAQQPAAIMSKRQQHWVKQCKFWAVIQEQLELLLNQLAPPVLQNVG